MSIVFGKWVSLEYGACTYDAVLGGGLEVPVEHLEGSELLEVGQVGVVLAHVHHVCTARVTSGEHLLSAPLLISSKLISNS